MTIEPVELYMPLPRQILFEPRDMPRSQSELNSNIQKAIGRFRIPNTHLVHTLGSRPCYDDMKPTGGHRAGNVRGVIVQVTTLPAL
jgi:hypothetical protein